MHSMDRLARDFDDLPALVQGLTRKGVRVEFVKEILVFAGEDSPRANLMVSVMGASPTSNAPSSGDAHSHPDVVGQLVQRGIPKTVLACDYEPRESKASPTSAREELPNWLLEL